MPRNRYGADFNNWKRAPAEDKDGIAYHQAWKGMIEGDYLSDMTSMLSRAAVDGLDTVMPCNKRLADCGLQDMEAMRDWTLAVSYAVPLVIKDIDKQLKPSLDSARATIVRLIRSKGITK
jgi:hypothetical protein